MVTAGFAARHIGTGTTFPSIEMGTPVGGPCAPGYSCAFGSASRNSIARGYL